MEKIAKIVKIHGIKGELKLRSNTDFIDEHFGSGKEIAVMYQNKLEKFKIATCRIHKGSVMISLKDKQDINLVEKYKDCDVYQESVKVEANEGHYLYRDLIDKEVYDQNDEYVGVVTNVLDYPSSSMLIIATNAGERMVPFVDHFIIDVNEKIIINIIEGLI